MICLYFHSLWVYAFISLNDCFLLSLKSRLPAGATVALIGGAPLGWKTLSLIFSLSSFVSFRSFDCAETFE